MFTTRKSKTLFTSYDNTIALPLLGTFAVYEFGESNHSVENCELSRTAIRVTDSIVCNAPDRKMMFICCAFHHSL